MKFEVINLKENVGSEIKVEVEDLLTPAVAEQMRLILQQRGVLVFRQLSLTEEQQLTLSRLMGTVREEGNKGVLNITIDPKLNAKAAYLKGSFFWHMDGTHDDVPPFASLLTGITLSAEGGQTEFANTYASYEALPQEIKDRIDNLRAIHSIEASMRKAGAVADEASVAYWRSLPDKPHPLVWTHEGGRKSLVLGIHASHVEAMDRAAGEALLQELMERTTQPQFVYRHEWQPGDMLIWDNTGVMHRVEPYAEDSGRLMRRTTLMGTEAIR
jgi:alpha-ketoglutarate-dependent taurine dioxygenase